MYKEVNMISIAICEDNAIQMQYVVDIINKYSIKENMDFTIDKFTCGEDLLNDNGPIDLCFLVYVNYSDSPIGFSLGS